MKTGDTVIFETNVYQDKPVRVKTEGEITDFLEDGIIEVRSIKDKKPIYYKVDRTDILEIRDRWEGIDPSKMIICGNCKHVHDNEWISYDIRCKNEKIAKHFKKLVNISFMQAGCVMFEYKDGTFPEKEQDE